MNKTERLKDLVQPIADLLDVGFYGEDGRLRMEFWHSIGLSFPHGFLDMTKLYKICAHASEHHVLVAFRVTGSMYMLVYFSWKADKIYVYLVDGPMLRKRVNRLSSSMTDRDLELFIERPHNSLTLEAALGDSRIVTFAKYVNTDDDWMKFENQRTSDNA